MNIENGTWLPLSKTGKLWVGLFGRFYAGEVLTPIHAVASTIAKARGGRQVTRDDLNAALERINPDDE